MEIIKLYSKKDIIELAKLKKSKYLSMKDTFKYITNERKSFHVTNISEAYNIENYLINNNVAIIDPPYSVVVDFMNDKKIANIGIVDDNGYISYDLSYCLLCLFDGYCDYILVGNDNKYFPAVIISNKIKRYILRRKSIRLWSSRLSKNILHKISNKEFTFNVTVFIGNKYGESKFNISYYNVIDIKDNLYDDINTKDLSKKENDCLCGLQYIKRKYNLCQAPYYYDKKYITTDKDISMVLQAIVKYIEYYNVLYTKEPLQLNKWSISLVDIK